MPTLLGPGYRLCFKKMTTEAAIEISELNYQWPGSDSTLLNIPELRVKKGERIFIQGQSGSGKSTLLSLLTGILEFSKGSISILNTKLESLSPSQKDLFRAEHIGYIFQQFNLIPFLNSVDNVLLALNFSQSKAKKVSDKKQKAYDLLLQMGIIKADHYKAVNQLSVGQQQRVAAARAFIGGPEIIIADEPTSSLDTDSQSSFIELLKKQCHENQSTLIFVSHNQQLIPHFDRCLEMSSFSGNSST